jgi:hypothetical protein
MKRRKRDVESIEFAGVGHAPALMADEQIAAVREFLTRAEGRRTEEPAAEKSA